MQTQIIMTLLQNDVYIINICRYIVYKLHKTNGNIWFVEFKILGIFSNYAVGFEFKFYIPVALEKTQINEILKWIEIVSASSYKYIMHLMRGSRTGRDLWLWAAVNVVLFLALNAQSCNFIIQCGFGTMETGNCASKLMVFFKEKVMKKIHGILSLKKI